MATPKLYQIPDKKGNTIICEYCNNTYFYDAKLDNIKHVDYICSKCNNYGIILYAGKKK